MPLFRKHCGSLENSIKETVVVKTPEELKNEIYKDWEMWEGSLRKDNMPFSKDSFDIKIENYIFDSRIGWHTQIVSADLMEKDKFMAIGFLSEPFE